MHVTLLCKCRFSIFPNLYLTLNTAACKPAVPAYICCSVEAMWWDSQMLIVICRPHLGLEAGGFATVVSESPHQIRQIPAGIPQA